MNLRRFAGVSGAGARGAWRGPVLPSMACRAGSRNPERSEESLGRKATESSRLWNCREGRFELEDVLRDVGA
jgi:hypothetical protein